MFKISPRIQTFVSKVFSFLSINFCVFLFLLSDINFFVKGESTNLLYVPRRTVQQPAGEAGRPAGHNCPHHMRRRRGQKALFARP